VSRFDDLVARTCPKGVPFRPLADLIRYEQPSKYLVASTEYSVAHPTPVLTAGQTFILGYTAETEGIYEASPDRPVVIFDDFTTAFKWVDFRFKAKSSAMKMLTALDESRVGLRYLFYAMQTIKYAPQDHARQWISTYSRFRIPVPPLVVQQEVVGILDSFSRLEAELEAELKARRVQYEFYRERLLTFREAAE
jgi:type I restriction enzyme S subunit